MLRQIGLQLNFGVFNVNLTSNGQSGDAGDALPQSMVERATDLETNRSVTARNNERETVEEIALQSDTTVSENGTGSTGTTASGDSAPLANNSSGTAVPQSEMTSPGDITEDPPTLAAIHMTLLSVCLCCVLVVYWMLLLSCASVFSSVMFKQSYNDMQTNYTVSQ